MGEFDKNQPVDKKSADAKRKQILVGVLGAVLACVLGFHFMKGSPESASANASTEILPDAAPAMRSAAEEHHDLLNDSTAHLLQRTTGTDAEFSKVPHNPFQWSERFRGVPKTIVKTVDPVPVDPYPPQQAPQIPEIPASSLRLDGIFRVGTKLQAFVNGKIVSTGSTVGDAKVLDIQEDHIVVRHKDWPNGPSTTAMLQPKLKKPEKTEKSE